MGMHLMLEIGTRSVYGNVLPDFMVWNRVTELPLFWKPFYSVPFTLLAIVVVPALFAFVFGYFTFRSRIRGVYFSIITQALALSTWLMFNRNAMNLGGTNGLSGFKSIFGFTLNSAATQRGLYVATALCLCGAFLLCRYITRSPAGRVLIAIRDSETRVLFSGYSPAAFKLFVFVVSAVLAGVAGALYAPQVGIITPAKIGVLPSIEMIIWVAVGGRGTLLGPVVGALGVNWLQSLLTTHYPDLWLLVLGGLFVAVVLFFPDGVVGTAQKLLARLRPRGGAGARLRARPEAATGSEEAKTPTEVATGGALSGIMNFTAAAAEGSIIYLENVTVDFDGFKALHDLNFFMDYRELRVVIGPNGAGKTTLLDVISGKVQPAAGRVIFGKHTDLIGRRENEIAALGDRPQVPDPVDLRQPDACARTSSCRCARPSKGVLATLRARLDGEQRDRIEATLETIGLGGRGGERAGGLSPRREAVARDRHGHRPAGRAAPGGRAGGRA